MSVEQEDRQRRAVAQAWLEQADPSFVAFLRRLTFHRNVKWQTPDYIPGYPDEREVTEEIEEAEAFSSAYKPDPWDDAESPGHAVMLDLDVQAFLTPSSRPGHSHLWVNLPPVDDELLWRFIEAGVNIGLIEEGYYRACRERGMTSLRAPWVKKQPGDG